MTVVDISPTVIDDGDGSADSTLTSQQVMSAAGISYRRLDFWVRTGKIPGVERLANLGTGVPRRWTPEECALVVALATIVRAGIPLTLAVDVLNTGRVDGRTLTARLSDQVTLTVTDLPDLPVPE